MNRIFYLILFLSLTITILKGQVTVEGKITNDKGEPLELALVYLMGTNYAEVTDVQGRYSIKDVDPGYYKIKASFLGYESKTEELDLQKDITWDAKLRGIIFDLDEIEIRSSWNDEDAPFSYQNYTEESLEALNTGQDVPLVLRYTPSVVTTSDAGNGIGYTGIRVRGSDPTRTNVTLNGIPVNDAESQLVFWVDLPDILSSVSETQIHRGVGSSSIGTSAFGANINLTTQDYHIRPYVDLASSLGSFNTSKISASLGTGLMNSKVSIDGRYSLIRSDGYIDRASSTLQSYALTAQYFTPKSALRFNLFSGHEITYQAWNGTPAQFLKDNPTYNTAGTQKPGEPFVNELDNYNQTHYQLHFDRELNENWVFNISGHYTRGIGYFENYLSGQDLQDFNIMETSGDLYDVVIRRWLSNHFYGAIYSFKFEDTKHEINFTGGINQYDGKHFGEAAWNGRDYNSLDSLFLGRTFPIQYYENDALKNEINHFIKWQYKISDALSSYADIQYRFVSYKVEGPLADQRILDLSETYHFINPKFGLNLKFNENSRLYSSVGIANREPNRNDFTDRGTEELAKPERLTDVELGFIHNQADSYLSINLYHMQYKDQLVLTGRINDVGEYIRENVDNSYRQGIELIIQKNILSSLRWNANLNLSRNKISDYRYFRDNWFTGIQDSTFFEQTDLAFSPGTIFANELHYRVLNSTKLEQTIELSLLSKYVGAQFIDNSSSDFAKLDAYFHNDFRILYSLEPGFMKKLTVQFTVHNLLNASYVSNAWTYRFISPDYNPVPDDPYAQFESGDSYNLTGYYPQAPRHFMLSLVANF